MAEGRQVIRRLRPAKRISVRPRRGGRWLPHTAWWVGTLATGLLVGAPTTTARADAGGAVEGSVRLQLEGASLSRLGPVIVYLEPLGPTAVPTPSAPARITQRNARFHPAFQVVTVGQPVEMPNADAIYHNVFSYSRPNDFDLGTYPAGESRTVVFRYPGVVKTYCSIHETMNATILVLPSPHYDRVTRSGRFAIRDVPPGRYRLRIWCEKLPERSREIRVDAGRAQHVDVDLTPAPA